MLNKAQELYLYLYLYRLLIYYFPYHYIVFGLVNMPFVKTLIEFGIFWGEGFFYVYILYIYIYIYNVPDFGRVFLMLKYTDITQNTYIQN